MKLAFIINSLNKGGAERVVSLLTKELSKEHEVFIILFDNNIAYEYGGKIIDIECKSISGKIGKLFNIFKRRTRLKKIFYENKFDKIFAFMESAYLPAILTGYPIISSVRNNPKVYSKFITKYILPKARKVVAVSNHIEKELNNLGIENTQTIFNPTIEDEDYKIIENLSKYKPFVLAVGRLHKQKNFDLLIRAYENTKVSNDVKLLIVGEGLGRDNLELLIKELDLKNKVFLVGQKDNIKDYYLQSELFILSSKYEGFPNVLVEALSNECVCISTDCPTGPSEIIKNNENGLLIINENLEEMTKAIDRLYFDENMKKIFSNNAKKSISHLNIKKIAKDWIEV
ncbi:MAG: glycosyltransferase family 4 protein [Aliarcobacter butzleri]|nr:MAG: glycosyltransferase family 4 protein [Aliarcobacter butzleri]